MSSSLIEKLGLRKPGNATSEKSAKRTPTLRLELKLEKPTEKTFPEFSYAQLAKNALGQRNADGAPTSPYGEDDVEDSALLALARAMEEKYGPKGARKRKRLEHERDLIDVGAGYDESDPFVDNSGAIDDYVPMEYEAECGGFYINKGDLLFRQVTASEDEQTQHGAGGESGDDFQTIPSKKHKLLSMKRAKLSGEKGKKDGVRSRKLSTGKPLRDGVLLTRGRPRKNSMQKPKLMKSLLSTGDNHSFSGSGTRTVGQTTAGLGAVSTPAQEDRQPVANVASTTPPDIRPEPPLASENSVSQVGGLLDGNSMDDGSPSAADGDDPSQVTELPSGLPDDLVQCVQEFEQEVARGVFTPHTSKHLDSTYDDRLLEVETKLRGVKGKARVAVFAYLSSFLQHSKDSLQRRAKKLNIAAEEAMLEEPLQKLKEVVEAVLPEQIIKFKEEVRRAVEAHSQNNPSSSSEEKTTLLENALSGEGDEETEPSMLESPVTESKSLSENAELKPKKFRAPRPKFAWNDETRRLLHAVVSAKVNGIKVTMLRIVGAEESIRTFLEQRVKPIWPANWMTVSILYRESKPVHLQITNPQQFKSTQAVQQRRQTSGAPKRPYHRTAPFKAAIVDNSSSKPPPTTSVASQLTILDMLDDADQRSGQDNPFPKSANVNAAKSDKPAQMSDVKEASKVFKETLERKSLLTKVGQTSPKMSSAAAAVPVAATPPSSVGVAKDSSAGSGTTGKATTAAAMATGSTSKKTVSIAGSASGSKVPVASPVIGQTATNNPARSGSASESKVPVASPVIGQVTASNPPARSGSVSGSKVPVASPGIGPTDASNPSARSGSNPARSGSASGSKVPVASPSIGQTTASNPPARSGSASGSKVRVTSPVISQTGNTTARWGSAVSVETTPIPAVGQTMRPRVPSESSVKDLPAGAAKLLSTGMPGRMSRMHSSQKIPLPSFNTVVPNKGHLARVPPALQQEPLQHPRSPQNPTILASLTSQPLTLTQPRIGHLHHPPLQQPNAAVIDMRHQHQMSVASSPPVRPPQLGMPYNQRTWKT